MAKRRRGPQRTIEKRILVSPAEDLRIERLLDRTLDTLDTRLRFAELARAAIAVLLENEAELGVELSRASDWLVRPPTQDLNATIEFEQDLAELIRHAVQQR